MKFTGKLLLCVIILVYSSQLCAQESGNNKVKRFGFMVGANLSNMNFNKGVPAPSQAVAASWKTGITFGFLMRLPLSENLFLQPEYSYSQRRGADKSIGKDYSIGYLSLPLLLNYKVSPKISLVAGPQAELLIHATSDSNGVKTNITHDVEERNIGATAGIDVLLTNSFFISGRFLYGLNHIGIGQRSNVKEFKYEVVNLSIGIEF